MPGKFQLTAARRRLGFARQRVLTAKSAFQLTAARRRLDGLIDGQQQGGEFQLTAARRRLGLPLGRCCCFDLISTHSRAKAAGSFAPWRFAWFIFQLTAARRRLAVTRFPVGKPASFQLTAARRRLAITQFHSKLFNTISTHSRAKAAGH